MKCFFSGHVSFSMLPDMFFATPNMPTLGIFLLDWIPCSALFKYKISFEKDPEIQILTFVRCHFRIPLLFKTFHVFHHVFTSKSTPRHIHKS